MARAPKVTRTITTTKATIMCLNIESQSTLEIDVLLPRTFKNNEAILKAAKSKVETDTIKAVHVVKVEILETLYGMDESKFIDNAEVMPPRKKAEATEDDAPVEEN